MTRVRSSGGAILAGLGAAAVIAVSLAPPVAAAPLRDDPAPDPSASATTDPPAEPSDPPSDPGGGGTTEPSDPPTDPGGGDPSDPPTDPGGGDPSDPPTDPGGGDPSTPPGGGDPSNPPTDPGGGDPSTPPGGGDPSNPPTDPGGGDPGVPKTPVLSVGASVSASTVRPGGSLTVTATVSSANAPAAGAALRMAVSRGSISPAGRSLGTVAAGRSVATIATVTVPSNAKAGTIRLTVGASAAKAAGVSRGYTLIVTQPSGALPPGVDLNHLPPDAPPLTPPAGPAANPLADLKGPQVALPPVTNPQTAPSPMPLVPVSSLRPLPGAVFTDDDLRALQGAALAAVSTATLLLLLRLRMMRRADAPVRRARRLYPQLDGKRITAARLRALPPLPAPARYFSLSWMPPRRPRGVQI